MEGFMRSSCYLKTISRILILAILHLCWLTSYGYAEMVPTESATQIQDDRQRILDLLDRQEVIDELEKYGISKVEAVARINSLTDEEVTQIAGKLDELPEGGLDFLMAFYLAAVLIGYLFILPFIWIGCIFKEGPTGECVQAFNEKYLKNIGMESAVRDEEVVSSIDISGCLSKCQTNLKECMYSTEVEECKSDKTNCDKECLDYGKYSGDYLSYAEDTNDKIYCYSGCNFEFSSCINADKAITSDSQCKDTKRKCFEFCSPETSWGGRKWCQDPDSKEYYSCDVGPSTGYESF
jgi:Family of unknown function (DUF6627)